MGGLDYYPSKFRHQEEEEKKEKRREQRKQHYEANKEKILERDKQHYEANKEKILEQKKQHYEANKEKILEYNRQYHQTPVGRKSHRIKDWKRQGIKLPDEYPDWDIFYEEEYMKATKCEECLVELTEGKRITSTTKCLDHCHITGEFRNILCQRCNSKRK